MLLTDALKVYLSAPDRWHQNCAAKRVQDGRMQVLLHRGRGKTEYELRESFPEDRTFLIQTDALGVHGSFTAQPVVTKAVETLDVVVVLPSEIIEIHRFRAVEYTPKRVRIEDEVIWTGAMEDVPDEYAKTAQAAIASARYPTQGYVT